MRSNVTIRKSAAGDFAAIAALTNRFIEGTAIHFGREPVTAAGLEAVWTSGGEHHPWLTALVDGAFAGYARSGTWRSRAAYDRTVEVAIYIDASHRRRGVGRALYEGLLSDLAAAGHHSAIAGITLPNPPSVALHEAVGFRHVGTFREVGWKLGAWHDVGFWQRSLP